MGRKLWFEGDGGGGEREFFVEQPYLGGILKKVFDPTMRSADMSAQQPLERPVSSLELALFQDNVASYQQLLDSLPGMTAQFCLTSEGQIKFRYVSAGCHTLLHISPSDLLADANTFVRLIHPSDRDRFHASVAHSAITLMPWKWEGRVQISTEPLRWIEITSQAQLQIAGGILWNGMMLDVTERKQAQDTLYASERKNHALLSVLPDMIFTYNRDGIYLNFFPSSDWDPAVAPDSFLGKSVYEVLPQDVAGTIHAAIHTALDANQPEAIHRLEYSLDIQGEPHDYEVRVVAVTADQAMAIVRDISDRKQAEIALQNYADRQALLNQLTHQIRNSLDQDTIIETAISAICQKLQLDFCGLLWFHPDVSPPIWQVVQAVEANNLEPHTLESHPASLVGPVEEMLMLNGIVRIDDVAQYPEPIHRAYLEMLGGRSVIEVRILLQNGQLGVLAGTRHQQQVWTDHEVELLQAVAGQIAIALNQAILYTESRNRAQELADALLELQQAQMQMIQSEKMSSLGQLVAGVAHEINNPVNFIYGNLAHANDYISDVLGLVDLYQHHYPKPVPEVLDEIAAIDLDFVKEDLLKLLKSMKVGADRIQMIVGSLRTFSRMDETEKKPVNIHDGIESTLMILQNRIKAKHDRVEIKILKEYGTLPPVACYAGQLNQVFMNILVNAIDAMEEMGLNKPEPNWSPTITIQTEYLAQPELPTLDQCSLPAIAQIRIIDNGTGMPEAVRSRIFDPFYTTKPVGKGTGMGMSISYQIITEKHEGTLICNSTLGVGTEFIIQIPIS
jgi:signal transduction histidine kinase/PAS domain-containing protein